MIRRMIRRLMMMTYNFDLNSVPFIISISNNVNTIIMISILVSVDRIRCRL